MNLDCDSEHRASFGLTSFRHSWKSYGDPCNWSRNPFEGLPVPKLESSTALPHQRDSLELLPTKVETEFLSNMEVEAIKMIPKLQPSKRDSLGSKPVQSRRKSMEQLLLKVDKEQVAPLRRDSLELNFSVLLDQDFSQAKRRQIEEEKDDDAFLNLVVAASPKKTTKMQPSPFEADPTDSHKTTPKISTREHGESPKKTKLGTNWNLQLFLDTANKSEPSLLASSVRKPHSEDGSVASSGSQRQRRRRPGQTRGRSPSGRKNNPTQNAHDLREQSQCASRIGRAKSRSRSRSASRERKQKAAIADSPAALLGDNNNVEQQTTRHRDSMVELLKVTKELRDRATKRRECCKSPSPDRRLRRVNAIGSGKAIQRTDTKRSQSDLASPRSRLYPERGHLRRAKTVTTTDHAPKRPVRASSPKRMATKSEK